jgi:hypothetical protein
MPKSSFEFRSVDKGWEELRKTVKAIAQRGSYVKVGVIGKKAAKAHPDGSKRALTNVELAVIQEFGAPKAGIPARPAIGLTFEKNRAAYQDTIRQGLVKVYENEMDPVTLLGLVGAKMAADIKNTVTQGGSPFEPNSPDWFKRKLEKGYSKKRKVEGPQLPPRPLVDTGRYIGSMSWQVVDREGKSPGQSGPEGGEE